MYKICNINVIRKSKLIKSDKNEWYDAHMIFMITCDKKLEYEHCANYSVKHLFYTLGALLDIIVEKNFCLFTQA